MEYNPWFVMLLGMGTVFLGLFCLVMLTKLMSVALRGSGKKGGDGGSAAPTVLPSTPAPAPDPGGALFANEQEHKRFDAAVACALAEFMGEGVEQIRIHSIRRLDEPYFDRGGFTAAVSAALATFMGRNVKGIRIVNITKLNEN